MKIKSAKRFVIPSLIVLLAVGAAINYLRPPTVFSQARSAGGESNVWRSTKAFLSNVRIAAGNYLNFGATFGTSGYGFRDNAGTIEWKNSGGAWAAITSGAPGGADTQVQFNNAGAFGGSANLTWASSQFNIASTAGDTIRIQTSGTESKIINTSGQGRMWIGDGDFAGSAYNFIMDHTNSGVFLTTASPTVGQYPFNGLHMLNVSVGVSYHAASATSGLFDFWKSRGNFGTPVIGNNGDDLGMIRFWGGDGGSFGAYDQAAAILAEIDGTPGAGTDMPGRLSFWTTPDGSATSAQRMTILNSGNVGIGTATPQDKLHVGAGADPPTNQASIYTSEAGVTRISLRDSTNDVEGHIVVSSGGFEIGTRTNHLLNLFTNNSTKIGISAAGLVNIGSAAPSGFQFGVTNSTNGNFTGSFTDAVFTGTTTVNPILQLIQNSTGTPDAGFGTGVNAYLETSTTNSVLAGSLNFAWTTATHASYASKLGVLLATGGAAPTEVVTIRGNTASGATLTINGYLSWSGQSYLAANYTNATTTMSNTALSVNVTTGLKYTFRLVLYVNNDVAADGIKVDFDGGAATMTNFRAHGTIFDTALLLSSQVNALATDYAVATITGDGMVEIYGSMEPSSTSTFIVRAAKNSHTTGTLTIYRGSHIEVQQSQ